MNNFLEAAKTGRNKWWAYVLTFLSTIVAVAIANIVFQKAVPALKAITPDNAFGKDLRTFILVACVFGLALLALLFAFHKFHKRPAFSLISTVNRFSWPLYFKGLFVWGGLLFAAALITDYGLFQNFLNKFNLLHFIILLLAGFISIGIQSFFEEILIRGYWLQGMGLKIKKTVYLVIANGLVFGVLHFGYGIESFLSSWIFGIAFALIVLRLERIEFAAGAHNANNLVLALFFLDLGDAVKEDFSWTIDWLGLCLHLFITSLLVLIVYKFFP
ncbi:MAG TPA: type II CAAX endopeptidase family protein, partial [Flavobacterium sp.]|nr:type II CAAX endopeptidase family protein [Flavobacterium sp.]